MGHAETWAYFQQKVGETNFYEKICKTAIIWKESQLYFWEDEMEKNGSLKRRRCALTGSLCEQLLVLETRYGVKQNDIIRIAVCHGIQKLKNGYRPYRNFNVAKWRKATGVQKEIYLPASTWEELDKLAKTGTDYMKTSIQYELEEHIPYGELIEMFIRLEIKGLSAFLEKIDPSHEEWEDRWMEENIHHIQGKVNNLFEKETMTVNVTIPAVFKKKWDQIQKDTGLDKDTIGSYLMLQAMFHEYCYCDFTTVDRDADVIPLIEANLLGKKKFEVLNVIKILMQANKLIFMDDKSLEYLRNDFEETPDKMGNGKIESPKNC